MNSILFGLKKYFINEKKWEKLTTFDKLLLNSIKLIKIVLPTKYDRIWPTLQGKYILLINKK